jgi:hypothetical protein
MTDSLSGPSYLTREDSGQAEICEEERAKSSLAARGSNQVDETRSSDHLAPAIHATKIFPWPKVQTDLPKKISFLPFLIPRG